MLVYNNQSHVAKEFRKIVVWGIYLKRDLIYIDDLVDFVSLALDKQTTGFDNVGGMSFLSVNEIVNLVGQAAAKSVEVVHDLVNQQ